MPPWRSDVAGIIAAMSSGPSRTVPVASARPATLELAVAIVATALAIVFVVAFAQFAPGLWRDEINSVNTQAAPTWAAMWQLSQFESFPLLWMLALRAWMAIGSSDAALRVFGCACGLAIPAAIWFAARRSARPSMPVLALALVAVNPAIVRWSASVRPWGLGAALAIVTFALVRDASFSPTRGRIIAAAIAALASVQCLYQNAVLLAAMIAAAAIVLAIRGEWRRIAVPVGIGAAAALSLVPYAPVIARRSEWNALGESAVPMSYLFTRLAGTANAAGPLVAICWLAAGAGALALGVAAGARSARSSQPAAAPAAAAYAAWTMAAALAGLLTFYWWFRYPTQPWYYVGLLALVAVCADSILAATLAPRTARVLRTGLAAVVIATGASSTWTALHEPMTNLDLVATRLRVDSADGDLVIVNPWPFAITLSRYDPGRARITTAPPLEDYRVHRYDLLKRAMLDADPIAPLLAEIETVLRSGHRVWYVGRLDATPPGARVTSPGRPPLADSGWNSTPYEVAWSQQTGAFLRDRSAQMSRVAIDTRGGHLEDAAVAVFSGWR